LHVSLVVEGRSRQYCAWKGIRQRLDLYAKDIFQVWIESAMELRHLRYFVTVAELGSISRAAEKLYIAQPPLSAQIRQLEAEVGVSLLTRQARGVRLTAAGETFLEDARAILSRARQAPQRAREREAGQRGLLRIGLVPSTLHSVLPGLLRRLARAGVPAQGVEVREMITSHQARALRQGEIDLGIARPGDESLPAEVVTQIDDPYCLAVPAAHALARRDDAVPLRDAAGERFVSFTRYREADYHDRTAALCADAGFEPDVRHEAGQFVNVLSLVACGLGVAIVPASFVVLPTPRVAFVRLQPTRDASRLALLRPEGALADAWLQGITDAATRELNLLARRLQRRWRPAQV
jgi:DNA-binding transcriptional LysR family regulator